MSNISWKKKNLKISNILFFLQLVVCGAIIGLYLSRLIGFVGIELTPAIDTIGASAGASVIALAKVAKTLHFL